MSYTIIKPADHQAWLAERAKGIGSSEVGAIMGVSPYASPYSVWAKKVAQIETGQIENSEENFFMRAGHYLEDAVAKFFADETGAQIIKSSAGDWMAVDNERPYLRVSPDRTYWMPGETHNAENKCILECKTTQRQITTDSIPLIWVFQLQYQLGVMGFKRGALAWLTAGREFNYMQFDFDADIFALITSALTSFWLGNVMERREPAAINVDDVLAKYPRHTAGKVEVATDDALAAYQELKAVKAKAKEYGDRQKELENELKVAIGDAEALVAQSPDGAAPVTLATFKSAKDSEKFDEKALKAAEPETWAKYTKTVAGSRRFILK